MATRTMQVHRQLHPCPFPSLHRQDAEGGEEAKDCETQPEEKGEIQLGEGEPESKKGADQVSPLDEPVFEVPEFSPELDLGFPEPGATTRRNITPAEAERVRRGSSIEDLYIGRNSVWGNPFKIGLDGDRKTVIRKFEEYLEASGLGRKVAELRGCVLACLCEKERPCHGDVLIRRADAGRKAPEEGREQGQDHALNNEDAQPMRDVDEFAVGQDQRESWSPMDGTVSGPIGQGAPVLPSSWVRSRPLQMAGASALRDAGHRRPAWSRTTGSTRSETPSTTTSEGPRGRRRGT